MDTTVPLPVLPGKAEEWAGFRAVNKGPAVIEEGKHPGGDGDGRPLTGILVSHDIPVIAKILDNPMDEPEVTATVPTLIAFKSQMDQPPDISQFCFRKIQQAQPKASLP